jgi:hypothetical protein
MAFCRHPHYQLSFYPPHPLKCDSSLQCHGFERAKTEKATRSDPKPVFITDDMRTIIDRWANKDANPNNYLFPILEPGLTALRQYELIELSLGHTNILTAFKKKVAQAVVENPI